MFSQLVRTKSVALGDVEGLGAAEEAEDRVARRREIRKNRLRIFM